MDTSSLLQWHLSLTLNSFYRMSTSASALCALYVCPNRFLTMFSWRYLPISTLRRTLPVNFRLSMNPHTDDWNVFIILCFDNWLIGHNINEPLFGNYLPLEEGLALNLNKIESHSAKDALCQVWLKLTQWFWRSKYLNFVNASLGKGD